MEEEIRGITQRYVIVDSPAAGVDGDEFETILDEGADQEDAMLALESQWNHKTREEQKKRVLELVRMAVAMDSDRVPHVIGSFDPEYEAALTLGMDTYAGYTPIAKREG